MSAIARLFNYDSRADEDLVSDMRGLSLGGGASAANDATSNQLEREYRNWQTTQARLAAITRELGKSQAYEAANILERWTLTTANTGIAGESGEIAKAKMRGELLEKRVCDERTVDAFIESVVNAQAETAPDSHATASVSEDGLVRYRDYSRKLSVDRARLLRGLATDSQIAAMAMRYSAVSSGSQQWNIPRAVYEILVKKYGVTVEGFASPINTQIVRLGKPGEVSFCSLFPDTDAPFGSVGDYFTYDLVGKCATVNPPYVLDLMNGVAAKCESEMKRARAEKAKTRLFITVPNWLDAPYYSVLDNSESLSHKIVFKPGSHYYENSNENDGQVTARFGTTIFILSHGYDTATYSDVREAFEIRPARRPETRPLRSRRGKK